ncbi:hypothetical protein FQZ97_462000 [compost metagenome]
MPLAVHGTLGSGRPWALGLPAIFRHGREHGSSVGVAQHQAPDLNKDRRTRSPASRGNPTG